MDEGSANVQTETQQPQNKQNNENSPKHVSLPADLSKLNLTKPIGLARKFTSPLFTPEFLISPISSLVRRARFGHEEGIEFELAYAYPNTVFWKQKMSVWSRRDLRLRSETVLWVSELNGNVTPTIL